MITNTLELVEKVYQYTGNKLDKSSGIYIIAKIIEETKLKCHDDLFYVKCSIEKTQLSLNNKDRYISFDESRVTELKANLSIVNRCTELIYEPLRDMLRPVWDIYWKEGCTSLSTISVWILKADEDKGAKVFDRLKKT